MKKLLAPFCLTLIILIGNTGVSWSGDFQKGVTAYKNHDYATALREWMPLAKQGDASAQQKIGRLYRRGYGVPEDHGTAVKWYKLAAEQGNAAAQNDLGGMYYFGRGVFRNHNAAAKWYTLAAEQGNA